MVYIICKMLDIIAFIIYKYEQLIFNDLCYTLYSRSMPSATNKHNNSPWQEDTT